MKKVFFFLVVFTLSNQAFSQNFNASWTQVDFIGPQEHFRYLWFSDDNKTVYGTNKSIFAFNVADGKLIEKMAPAGGSMHMSQISDDQMLWMQGGYVLNTSKDPKYGYNKPQFDTYNFSTKKFKTQETGTRFISRAVFGTSENIGYAHSGLDRDEQIVEFQIDPFEIKRTITKESNYILAFAVNEEKSLLAYSTTGDVKVMKIIDLNTGASKKTLLKNEEIAQIQFTPDGNTIMASAYDELFVIDAATFEYKKYNVELNDDDMYIYAMAIHPNSRSVAVSSKFGTSIVDTKDGSVKKIDKGRSLGCTFSKDGQYLATSIRGIAGKTTCLRIFQDKQFANSNFGNSTKPVDVVEEKPPVESKDLSFNYVSKEPGFSITCPTEPKETRKQSKKDRLVLQISGGTKEYAANTTVLEIASSYKKSKYQKLSADVAKNFIGKKEYEVIEQEDITIEGQEGVRYLLKRNNLFYDYRVVTLDGYNYQLMFIYTETLQDLTTLETYFNSFKLKK